MNKPKIEFKSNIYETIRKSGELFYTVISIDDTKDIKEIVLLLNCMGIEGSNYDNIIKYFKRNNDMKPAISISSQYGGLMMGFAQLDYYKRMDLDIVSLNKFYKQQGITEKVIKEVRAYVKDIEKEYKKGRFFKLKNDPDSGLYKIMSFSFPRATLKIVNFKNIENIGNNIERDINQLKEIK